MGWYFRKSVGFGPFRLNLSKSGIGYSFGVRGARIGTGPRGTYVRLGRDGVYYQKYAGRGSRASKEVSGIPSRSGQAVPEVDPSELLDASAADLLREIRDKRGRTSWAPLFAISVVVALVIDAGLSSEPLQALVLGIVALIVWLQLRKLDQTRKIVHLTYTLDSSARTRYEALLRAVDSLGTCAGIWRVTSKQSTANPKYSSGASYAVERVAVSYLRRPPPMIQINLEVAGLNVGDQSVWFLPDRALIWSTSGVGAVEYAAMSCKSRPTAFVEDGPVPSDAQVLHTQWRHANRDGSPDRRFAHNNQLPVVQYAELSVESATGMFFLLHASNPKKAAVFCREVVMYGLSGRSEADAAGQPAAQSHHKSSQASPTAGGTRNSTAQSPSSGKPEGQQAENQGEEANVAVIRRVLQALKAGNLNLLRAKAPMSLGPGEVCHVSVEGCACLAGAYSSNQTPDRGNLYLTSEKLRYVGNKLSIDLVMRKILSCSLSPEISSVARVAAAMMKIALDCTEDPGVVQIASGMEPTLLHLAGRTPLLNELIVAAITSISAAARQQSYEPKNASSEQTGHAADERASHGKQSPWEVLHISPGASADEIAAAYRKIAQLYHPDKVAGLGAELRELAEQKMKEINAAYESLRTNRN